MYQLSIAKRHIDRLRIDKQYIDEMVHEDRGVGKGGMRPFAPTAQEATGLTCCLSVLTTIARPEEETSFLSFAIQNG
jgi:hypothetical protein